MLVNSCRHVNNLNEVQDSIDFGFQIASKEGVLANEKMRGICFNICDAMLSFNRKHRGFDEIIPTTKSVMYGSQLAAKPRLLKPVYLVEIQSTESELPRIRRELNDHGEVLEEKAGSLFYNIQAYLPVDASFGLSRRLGK